MEKSIGCVVMAAGNGSRFEGNKLAASFNGKTLIQRALEAVPEGMKAVVVTQYPEVEALAESFGFPFLRNAHPEWGISYTVRLGTQFLSGCEAIVYLVSDQPLLQKASVQRLAEKWRQHPDCIAALSHNGVRGNPCIFPRCFYPELLALTGDTGGNAVMKQHPERLLPVEADPTELADVDTRATYHQLLKAEEE